MGYQSAAQILKQAEDLKAKIDNKHTDLLVDSDTWTDYRQLQLIYQQVLITELEYALDKKVEQDLWNLGFKNHINMLQEFVRDKKNSRRSDYQALLTWCLETASGYYITLLQELCNTFDIDLPFRRRSNVFGQLNNRSHQLQINSPQTSSCLYICQYCLVHLGDIARYRNQRKQAENFYKQAVIVSPTSGHPYNQLALLEASCGNKLATVYYYIRAIAVKNPFPASTTNLTSTLNATIEKDVQLDKMPSKMTMAEFIQLFLCTHGRLQLNIELEQAELAVKSLNENMTPLVATQSFTTENLIQMTTINLYAFNLVEKVEELTNAERLVRNLLLDLIAGSLTAFLVPVYTLKMDDTLFDYYALPAVKLLMYYIKNHPNTLKESVFASKLQIWPSLCKLLNNVQKQLKLLNYSKYDNVPLYEDVYLQGFLEFANNFEQFDFKIFSNNDSEINKNEKLLRLKRMVEFSSWLSELDINGNKLINKREENGEILFEPGCMQPDPTDHLLEEMKSFKITNSVTEKRGTEKVTGILKPQGSLEKSREEREPKPSQLQDTKAINQKNITTDATKLKRTKQNVALQSIYKKIEESKQVKFSVEGTDNRNEKSVKFEPMQQPSTSGPQNQFNQFVRNQSFNRNNPGLNIQSPTSSQDYSNSYLNQQTNYNYPTNSKNDDISSSFMHNQNNFPINPPQSGYQNLQFPYSGWKSDDLSMPNWWGTNYSQQRPPNHQNDINYGSYMSAKSDEHPVWNNFLPQQNSYVMGDGNYSTAMSVRQAMLKEVSPAGMDTSNNRQNTPQQMAGGYSLFNANSWTPNLVDQLQNSKTTQQPTSLANTSGSSSQQSLFSGQGLQSLAQLVEQQNQNTATKK